MRRGKLNSGKGIIFNFFTIGNEQKMTEKTIYISLLALPEAELNAYWMSKVAVTYWHGRYLACSTARSKKMLFNRWKKYAVKFIELPAGAQEPCF
jgi:hypothetical protein